MVASIFAKNTPQPPQPAQQQQQPSATAAPPPAPSPQPPQPLSQPQPAAMKHDGPGALADFGPIQVLLDDPTVSEVMVNGPRLVYAERKGKLEKTDIKFRDDDHVRE